MDFSCELPPQLLYYPNPNFFGHLLLIVLNFHKTVLQVQPFILQGIIYCYASFPYFSCVPIYLIFTWLLEKYHFPLNALTYICPQWSSSAIFLPTHSLVSFSWSSSLWLGISLPRCSVICKFGEFTVHSLKIIYKLVK